MLKRPYPEGNPYAKWHISAIKIWKTWPGGPNTRTHSQGQTHIKEAPFGRLHKGGRAAFGREPPLWIPLYGSPPGYGFVYLGSPARFSTFV